MSVGAVTNNQGGLTPATYRPAGRRHRGPQTYTKALPGAIRAASAAASPA